MHGNEQDWRAGGQYVRLSDGLTHWRREGAAEGLPIVLVHGATVPSQDAIIPAEHVARVRSLLPRHSHCPVPAEHNLLLTHPDIVVDALVNWSR
jgi:pimeloyl-ACP methyl ester carboxylesterase